MERPENFAVCVKAALSQLCVRGWMLFQGEGISFALVLCWICCEEHGGGPGLGVGVCRVSRKGGSGSGSTGWRQLAL